MVRPLSRGGRQRPAKQIHQHRRERRKVSQPVSRHLRIRRCRKILPRRISPLGSQHLSCSLNSPARSRSRLHSRNKLHSRSRPSSYSRLRSHSRPPSRGRISLPRWLIARRHKEDSRHSRMNSPMRKVRCRKIIRFFVSSSPSHNFSHSQSNRHRLVVRHSRMPLIRRRHSS